MPRYIEVGVGSPENKAHFVLVDDISTDSLEGSGVTIHSCTATNFDGCSIMSLNLNDTAIGNNTLLLDGKGFATRQKDQYSLFEGSKYKTLMTVDDPVTPTNKTFTEVPLGEKPTDWDKNFNVYYYIKHVGHPNNEIHDVYYTHPTSSTWNSDTQYYYSNDAYHYYYIGNGETQVRIGCGDPGLSDDNYLPAYWVLSNGNSTTAQGDDGYWTGVNGDTVERLRVPSNPGAVQLRVTTTSNSRVSGMSGLMQGGANMGRYLFESEYNTGWKSGISDQKKGMWRTNVHDKVRIKNETVTQFGFVNYDNKRYFGIWLSYPTMPYYIGYHKYSSSSANPWTNNTGNSDLRAYNYDDPIADNEKAKIDSMIFFGIEIEKMNVDIEVKEGQVPPDIEPDLPISPNWNPFKPVTPTRRNLGSLAGSNESGFHVWDVSSGDYKALVGDLWNWGSLTHSVAEQLQDEGYVKNILSNIGNIGISFLWNTASSWVKEGKIDPLAAIQTCMALPAFIHPQVVAENDYGKIKIAGLEQNQYGYCCQSETYVAEPIIIDCKNLVVTGSYLDFSPYTMAQIYLPYLGTFELDPKDFIGGYIEVNYSCCVVDGTISATVVCYPGVAATYPTQYGPFVGNAAYRLPIAQKDVNAFQRDLGYLNAIGTAVTGVIEKSPAKIIDASGQMANSYMMKQVMNGSPLGSGSALVSQTREVYVIVSTPKPLYDNWDDSKILGHSSGKKLKIKENSGYVTYSGAWLNTITATAAEIEDIRNILRGGIYQ